MRRHDQVVLSQFKSQHEPFHLYPFLTEGKRGQHQLDNKSVVENVWENLQLPELRRFGRGLNLFLEAEWEKPVVLFGRWARDLLPIASSDEPGRLDENWSERQCYSEHDTDIISNSDAPPLSCRRILVAGSLRRQTSYILREQKKDSQERRILSAGEVRVQLRTALVENSVFLQYLYTERLWLLLLKDMTQNRSKLSI